MGSEGVEVALIHLTDPLRPSKGGAVRYVISLAKYLATRKGRRVRILGVNDLSGQPVDPVIWRLVRAGRVSVDYVSGGKSVPGFVIRLLFRTLRERSEATIYHAQREIFAFPLALDPRKKFVLTVHAVPLADFRSKHPILYHLIKPFFRLVMRYVMMRASAIILVTRSLMRHVPITADQRAKTAVIPVGVDVETFRPPAGNERDLLRERFGIGAGEAVILFVGRLEKVKRPELVIRSLEYLISKKGLTEVKLLVAGDGSLLPRLKTLARSLGVDNKIMFLGHVPPDRMPSIYRVGDVLALTSVSEASPYVIKEGLASGVPFVSTASSYEITWLASVGVGYVVPVNTSPEVFGDALANMINLVKGPEGEVLRHRCRAVAEVLSTERMFGAVAKVYERVGT